MQEAVTMLYAALMVLSSLASVCGNLLLLLMLLLNKELQTETLGLTLSFSLSDLALGLSTIPFGAHNSMVRLDGYASEGALCQGSGFIFVLLQTSSIHSLTWATVDKFTEICFALSYRSIWTARRTQTVLVLVWLFCLVNATLPLLGFGSYSYSNATFICGPSFTPDNSGFNVLLVAVGMAVPILTMCSLYGCIVYIARKQVRRGTFMCNDQHCFYVPANTYFRTSIVMVATSVYLLVCWLPYISVCCYETFSGQQSPAMTSALSTWLVLSSAALNPWVTSMTHTRYRSALRRSVLRFLQVCWCSGKSPESRPQSPDLHLVTANHISSNTTTTSLPSQTPKSAQLPPQPPLSSSSPPIQPLPSTIQPSS